MAPKPAVDGFLAAGRALASARVILALAGLAALCLTGCGGGGSDATTAAAPGSQSQPAGEKRGEGAASSPSSPQSSSPSGSSTSPEGQSASPGASAPTGAPGPGGAKRGPRIAVPKGAPERAATPAEQEEATVADIALTSPAIGSEGSLPSTYTCDGENSWPELAWRGVPPGAEELALFAMSVAPAQGKLVFDWAIAGLDPSLEGLAAGRLPKGAVTAQNSFGHTAYEICPAQSETYVFALFALPRRLSPRQGFDPRALRDQALNVSGNVGLLAASYSR